MKAEKCPKCLGRRTFRIAGKKEPCTACKGSGVISGVRGAPVGLEARLFADLARRQALGVSKYGKPLHKAGLPLRACLVHAYEESLDLPLYLLAAIEGIDREALLNALAGLLAEGKTIRETCRIAKITRHQFNQIRQDPANALRFSRAADKISKKSIGILKHFMIGYNKK